MTRLPLAKVLVVLDADQRRQFRRQRGRVIFPHADGARVDPRDLGIDVTDVGRQRESLAESQQALDLNALGFRLTPALEVLVMKPPAKLSENCSARSSYCVKNTDAASCQFCQKKTPGPDHSVVKSQIRSPW